MNLWVSTDAAPEKANKRVGNSHVGNHWRRASRVPPDGDVANAINGEVRHDAVTSGATSAITTVFVWPANHISLDANADLAAMQRVVLKARLPHREASEPQARTLCTRDRIANEREAPANVENLKTRVAIGEVSRISLGAGVLAR